MWWDTLKKGVEFILAPTPANEGEDELTARRQAEWYREQYEQEIEKDTSPESFAGSDFGGYTTNDSLRDVDHYDDSDDGDE